MERRGQPDSPEDLGKEGTKCNGQTNPGKNQPGPRSPMTHREKQRYGGREVLGFRSGGESGEVSDHFPGQTNGAGGSAEQKK